MQKISTLARKLWPTTGRGQTDRQTDRQTHTYTPTHARARTRACTHRQKQTDRQRKQTLRTPFSKKKIDFLLMERSD